MSLRRVMTYHGNARGINNGVMARPDYQIYLRSQLNYPATIKRSGTLSVNLFNFSRR